MEAVKAIPTTPDPTRRVGYRNLWRAQAVVPLVVAGLMVIVIPAAWMRYSNFNGSECPTSLSPDTLWPTGAFVGIVAGFCLGGLLGKLATRRTDIQAGRPLLIAQVGLTLLMGMLTLAWWYETRAVANSDIQPITHYVMCIKNVQNDWTLVIFIVGAVIVGRWLWHRPGSYF